MRKIVVSEFVTLDMVMEGPGPQDPFKHAGWTMAYASPELMQFKYDELFAADTLLLGRTTYEGFAAAWPAMAGTGAFGERMNSIQKIVVSSTPATLAWNNSNLLTGNLSEEISKLVEQEGKDIVVFGSAQLTQSLMKENLIDEYRLLVYPLVLGEGKRLFTEGEHAKLSLKESKIFPSGVNLLQYGRA